MAACKGVTDRMISKTLKNTSAILWFLRTNRSPFPVKSHYRGFILTGRRTAEINSTLPASCEQYKTYNSIIYSHKRHYCTIKIRELDEMTFHRISDETLHILMEYFEELGDLGYFDQDFDIELSDGVLTIRLGGSYGTYVINKQTPNRQIWLSSPTSGPKRYDFTEFNCWVYRHNGVSLHELLSNEISNVIGKSVSFTALQYGSETNS